MAVSLICSTTQNGTRLESSPLELKILSQEDAEQLYEIYPDLPRSFLDGCPSCGKNNGLRVDGYLSIDGNEYICNCRDQLQRHKHYLNSGIGITYQILTWNDFHGDSNALQEALSYIAKLDENIEVGFGLVFLSPQYGNGKTLLATLILKEAIMHGYKCYMTTFQDMLSSMKKGWKDPQFEKWYKHKIDSAQVLLIDDVGKELMDSEGFNNDFARQTLDSLIRTRNQQSRPTIITSNFGGDDFQNIYGKAFMSLLSESNKVVMVTGQDYRRIAKTRCKGQRRIY